MGEIERSRVFVRDIEPDPGWEVRVIDPGQEVAIEPGTWEELVPESELRGAVEALSEAVAAARLFNRGGMTWLEYDRKLVEFERIASGGQ